MSKIVDKNHNSKIKNIIFDIGNVLVNYDKNSVVKKMLPEQNSVDFIAQTKPIFRQWSIGEINQKEVIKNIAAVTSITEKAATNLLRELANHQTPIEGSFKIITRLKELGFNLYAITDNTKEFIQYYRANSDKYIFINYFIDIANSAELGVLKPDPKMYKYILERHNLVPAETIFVDDLEVNVAAALDLGIRAVVFTSPAAFEADLLANGIDLLPQEI